LSRPDRTQRIGCLAAVTLAALTFVGCSVPPEQTIVGDFFAASRLRDTTALSRFATVVFEPRQQGTVATFTIERVSAERQVGDMRTKEVTVSAPVRSPDGLVVEKVLVVTLQKRSRGAESQATPPLYGGWIVTAFTDAPASPVIPRS
jgi:hypothetical protein